MIHEYWRDSFFYDLKMNITQSWFKEKNLKIDIILKPDVLGGSPGYIRSEEWTDETRAELSNKGYIRIEGLHDSIAWAGSKIYCKIMNGEHADVHITDLKGAFIWSQDTSATLNDFMQSNATRDFIKGMGRTALATMDFQKIVFIGIIGIGAVIGMKLMGVF